MAKNRKLTRANSAIKSQGSRVLPRVVSNARKSTPMSILRGGKQSFGPLYRKPLGFDD